MIKLGRARTLKFHDFPKRSVDTIYFVEKDYDGELNLSIINHLVDIRKCLSRKNLDFVYFPFLVQNLKNALRYNYPTIEQSSLDFSISSDILLRLLIEDKQRESFQPSFLQYSHSEEGIDYVKAYTLQIEQDENFWSLFQKLVCRFQSNEVPFFSSRRELSSSDLQPYDADAEFNSEIQDKMREIYRQVQELRLQGVSEWVLKQYLFPQKKLSRLVITEKYDVILPDYHDMVIKMEPLVKAVFILFLRHEEGILFKYLSDYREELDSIYQAIRSRMDKLAYLSEEKLRQSIDALTNPLSNSINEKCARVRAAFVSLFDESLARYYYIDGERGCAKKILLDRKMVEWR